MRALSSSLAVLFLLAWVGIAPAQPSFDCATATGAAERAICLSPRLSADDRRLDEAYRRARSSLGDAEREALRAGQRDWIRRRNACGADPACLAEAYRSRLQELGTLAAPPPGPADEAAPAGGLPSLARSLGGIARVEPGPNGTAIAVTAPGERVTLIEKTGVISAGYPWFLIRFEGGRGYQWGGDLCTEGVPQPGTRRTC
ncbi:lysozyme inhibitor LprI family protein [Prosthecomicrobium sp. N25]|uniref:lysozyme inhibitor LprI family protein n=1 Tax=Prosthecomicrobium sp. N25 TaxID=3129254 RepID=UPI0030785748